MHIECHSDVVLDIQSLNLLKLYLYKVVWKLCFPCYSCKHWNTLLYLFELNKENGFAAVLISYYFLTASVVPSPWNSEAHTKQIYWSVFF